MKRMIPQALIAWVKSLFHRIAPGSGDGDVEIGGNLEVDGNITANGSQSTFDNINFDRLSTGIATLSFSVNNVEAGHTAPVSTGLNFTFQGSEVFKLFARASNGGGTFDGMYMSFPRGLTVSNRPIFISGVQIGSTALTEDQLKKLIALIPAE